MRPGEKKTSILSISSIKGGVGKSVTAINLAASLAVTAAPEGGRVLLVDLDPQCNATDALLPGGVEEAQSLTHSIERKRPLDEVVVGTQVDNLDLVGASRRLASLQRTYEGSRLQHLLLDPLFNSERLPDYRYVILDLHGADNCLLTSALYQSDYYLIPLKSDAFGSNALTDMLLIAEELSQLNPNLTLLGCVLTQYRITAGGSRGRASAASRYFEKAIRQLAEEANFRVFNTIIPYSDAVDSSIAKGLPLLLSAPQAPVTLAYHRLAGEVAPLLIGRRRGRRRVPRVEVVRQAEDRYINEPADSEDFEEAPAA
jgi:chromosome partitioning protein